MNILRDLRGLRSLRGLRGLRGLILHDRLIYAHVGVTHRCNMRCRMCTVPERGNAETEAPARRFREVARQVADLGCVMVSLGGGEPFLRKDLPEIVGAFAQEGLRVRVLTNGVTADRGSLKEAAAAGAMDMSMSLDSLDPVVQASLEAMPDVLPKKMETLAVIREEFPAAGVHIINAVVTPQTLGGLVDVARFAEKIGFYSSFIPVHLEDGEHHFFADDAALRFQPDHEEELRAVYGELLRRRKKGGVVNSRTYLENSAKYAMGEEVDWQCAAGVLYVSVGPDARIAICHEFEDEGGVAPESFALRYLRGGWRAAARAKAGPCHKCYRPCWAEIDYLAGEAEAMLGALRLRLKGMIGHRRQARGIDPARVAEDILATGQNAGGGS